jgi:pimeloyl-ACP methyl ester carboxylesterase
MGKKFRTALAAVRTVQLGGEPQHILMQGESRSNPVLLVIHGGPAMPFPGVSARGVDYAVNLTTRELVKRYTVVFWDQRGTGKSYRPDLPPETLRVERFIRDGGELVDWLRAEFGQDRIALAGISWGSVIGLALASLYPDKFTAYYGIAQISNWAKSDELLYDRLLAEAERRGHRKALAALQFAGRPPYADFARWGVLREWNLRFGGLVHKAPGLNTPSFLYAVLMMLRSPDYTFRDTLNTLRSLKSTYTDELVRDFARIDFFASAPRLELPVTFLHGRHDGNIAPATIEAYYDAVEAPQGKRLIWLERSSHIFCPEDARIVERTLLADLK